jgi:3',5'-cyclic AMP phosphodiesterase CpdA
LTVSAGRTFARHAGKYVIVQISDIHLTTDGVLDDPDGVLPDGIRPHDNLDRALEFVAAEIQPDLYLLTGDLADGGDESCYRDLRDAIDAACSTSATTVTYLPGNHDRRAQFRRSLLDQEGTDGPINQVSWVGGLRVIALDSTVPGEGWGELSDESFDFLDDALSTSAPDGTVLALHHPPLPSPVTPAAELSLRRPDRLAEAIEGSDVRIVLAGHYHHELSGVLGSVPVWVSPASVYRCDVRVTDTFAARRACAVSRIDVGPSVVTAAALPVWLD